ncbi:hypothetical protein ACWCQN_39720 [Streptomyces sp. NPDC001984]
MTTGTLLAIIIPVVVVVALIALGSSLLMRRRRLRRRFGPECERTGEEAGGRRAAERELGTRQKATTEQMRNAMVHYRALFEELLSEVGWPRPADA